MNRPERVYRGPRVVQETTSVITYTVYNTVASVALGQAISITNAGAFTASAFATSITPLWAEYKVIGISAKIIPVNNVANFGLYTTGFHIAPFWGSVVPAQTVPVITKLDPSKCFVLSDRVYEVVWKRANGQSDYTSTAAAEPVCGGLVAYCGGSAPTASNPWLSIEVTYDLSVRGRLL